MSGPSKDDPYAAPITNPNSAVFVGRRDSYTIAATNVSDHLLKAMTSSDLLDLQKRIDVELLSRLKD